MYNAKCDSKINFTKDRIFKQSIKGSYKYMKYQVFTLCEVGDVKAQAIYLFLRGGICQQVLWFFCCRCTQDFSA